MPDTSQRVEHCERVGIRRGAQRPRLHRFPNARVERKEGAGPDACEFAKGLGYVLDDWQRWLVCGILSEDANYNLCARRSLILVPRQNGKNVVLEVVELYVFYVLRWERIVHTAHLLETSADHMRNLWAVIEQHEDLLRNTTLYRGSGKEMIQREEKDADGVLRTYTIKFVTRTNKIGRGKSPRLIVFDEALYLTDAQVQALVPSMSAQSMSDDQPMMIYTSSHPIAESKVLHRVRRSCMAGAPSAFFADWSVAVGSDIFDRDNWAIANPGLNIRISEQWIEEEELPGVGILSAEAFSIERLGIVNDEDLADSELPTWRACGHKDNEMAGAPRSIVVDVSDDLAWTSIAVAGERADGVPFVEIVEHLPGTKTAVAVLAALCKKYDLPVHLNPRAEAAGLIEALTKAKVPTVEVGTLSYMQACLQFRQLVVNLGLAHRFQRPLDDAVEGVVIRSVNEGWVWARRSSRQDVSPLVAATIAVWVAARPAEITTAVALVLS